MRVLLVFLIPSALALFIANSVYYDIGYLNGSEDDFKIWARRCTYIKLFGTIETRQQPGTTCPSTVKNITREYNYRLH
ncbi:hypothetical protein M2323_003321 [Rhodoblastus acidophilus]|uniref:hypothetical protein n=1 Tax=Rhodoblastus acidophilus TaxID=1074 RepID=UPI0022240A7A|nr:hypothetical protein [Rhodoblastus acidophilus]MCW2285372.1 hypothetical protein [Rhodoblastus acidophilus]MCW2334380.1 hypothetical protein [Rhodoblastus acidophilus]